MTLRKKSPLSPTGPEDRQGGERNFVYLLRCSDGTLYCGWTNDPESRLAAHNGGRGAKYTRSRLPVELVYCEPCASKADALKREAAIKRLSRRDKLALTTGFKTSSFNKTKTMSRS